jgi:beta-lactamase regulating signal transducer with metallopeptidase domain
MIDTLSGSSLAQAAVLALVHFLWQGVSIAALLAAALVLLPRAHAAERYAACCIALGAMLLAPLVTLSLLLAEPAPRMAAIAAPPLLSVSPLVLCVWAAGCLFSSARLLVGLGRLGRLVRRAQPVDEIWQQRLAKLGERLGLVRRVRLLASDEVDSPILVGWWRPAVLVPLSALSALPVSYLQALLAHELAHVRRFDFLVNVLQSGVEALLFYHPAVHWVSACMREEREFCCDDIAVRVTGDRKGLAQALASMESLRARLPDRALASRGGALLARIERIVGVRAPRSEPGRSPLALAALLCLCAGVVGACAQASRADESALGIEWLPSAVERWEPQMLDAAARHQVSPELIAIVTLAESLGDPAARSPVGALGLMQLMPSTAERIADERQLEGHSDRRLQEPAYNIDLGAWYLAHELAAVGAAGSDASERAIELTAVAYIGGHELMRAHRDQAVPLPEPIRAYRDLIVGMWNERALPESPTYGAWRAALGR